MKSPSDILQICNDIMAVALHKKNIIKNATSDPDYINRSFEYYYNCINARNKLRYEKHGDIAFIWDKPDELESDLLCLAEYHKKTIISKAVSKIDDIAWDFLENMVKCVFKFFVFCQILINKDKKKQI